MDASCGAESIDDATPRNSPGGNADAMIAAVAPEVVDLAADSLRAPVLPESVSTTDAVAAAAAAVTPLPDSLADLSEHVDVLEEYRAVCTREGRYEEAARAVAELARIRRDEEERRCAWLRARHARELEEIASAHALQMRAFLEEWEGFMRAFEAAGRSNIQAVQARHVEQVCWCRRINRPQLSTRVTAS